MINIGDIAANDTRCRVSEGLLNAAATKALLDNGIRISNETSLNTPDLSLNFITLYLESQGLCVTTLYVSLDSHIFTPVPHNRNRTTPGTPVFGRFRLAERGSMLSSHPSEHGQRIKDDVFDLVEEIALAIRVANQ